MRGAADTEGTGIVTLDDAYRYAYAHTLATTGETVIGPQHPKYDYRLTGQGEVVLAELAKPKASLELPRGFDRVLVSDVVRGQVVAEVAANAHNVIAMPPGSYRLRAWRHGKIYSGTVALAVGDHRVVGEDELSVTSAVPTTSKGDTPTSRWALSIAGGGEAGATTGVGVFPGVRAEVARGPLSLAVMVGTREGEGYHETSSLLLAGYRLRIARGDLAAWAGLEAGPGFILQTGIDPDAYSAAIAGGPFAGVSLRLTTRIAAMVEASVPAALLRRDGEASVVALPAGWLGFVVGL